MQRFDRYHIKTETSLHTNKSRTYQNFFYTFNVDGVTWCGIDSQPEIALSRNKYQDIDLENPSPSQRQQLLMSPKQPFNTLYFSLPAKCYVMYKMDDPSINAFGYLILDNDNKE